MKTKFLNLRGLSDEIGVPVNTLRTLYRMRKISAIKAGHRTLLFDPEKVRIELTSFEVKAVA